MSVFIVYEVDFGHSCIFGIVDSLDKARVIQTRQELSNNKDWIKYTIEEWDVK